MGGGKADSYEGIGAFRALWNDGSAADWIRPPGGT
jgi:hypothetical protein